MAVTARAPRTVLTIGPATPDHPYGAVKQILVYPDDHDTLLVPWVWGWKGIADRLGMSERYAREIGSPDGQHPLPLIRMGGRVAAAEDRLRQWHERHSAGQCGCDVDNTGKGPRT